MTKFKNYLFPTFVKYIGISIIVISFIITIMLLLSKKATFSDFFNANAEIKLFAVHAMLILGLVAVTFSKEKHEDEYLNHIRVQSFFITVSIHAAFFILFSFTSLTILMINFPAIILMNSILLVYLIVFYYKKWN